MIDVPSPNFDDRFEGQPVDMLVFHYTGMPTVEAAIERLRDPIAQVSAHYLIDEDGSVVRMVDEAQRAWHAGVSSWRDATDVNGRSIGIELVNPGHEFGYRPFPEAQMAAAIDLALDILRRHPIPARNVVGHSDVAPTRKTDPGELFDWPGLAAAGIGLWPADDATPAQGDILKMLVIYGYDIDDPKAAITAFQRHFRPSRIDGIADAETVARLAGVLKLAV